MNKVAYPAIVVYGRGRIQNHVSAYHSPGLNNASVEEHAAFLYRGARRNQRRRVAHFAETVPDALGHFSTQGVITYGHHQGITRQGRCVIRTLYGHTGHFFHCGGIIKNAGDGYARRLQAVQ
jgi:hypothetical protein